MDLAGENTPFLERRRLRNDSVFRPLFQQRYILTALGFLGFVNVYAMRVNLSVAMVAMVGTSQDNDQVEACEQLIKKQSSLNVTESVTGKGEFDWNSGQQAQILGSFFYGYVITQIPGGILAEKFGSKWLYGLGVLITAIFTLLTPAAARMGVWALFLVRFIEGLGEGVTYPAMNALIGRWVPKNERSRLATIIFNGSAIGTVISLSLSGILSDSELFGGWPSVFYVFGFFGIMWFGLWVLLVYDSPEEHPHITKAEINYIYKGLPTSYNQPRAPIPWRAILTSVPVWALMITHFGQNWGFYTLLTELPTYLANILHFDLKKNGILSALPYLMQACFSVLASIVADKMRSTGRFSITTIRKIFNSLALYLPAICVLLVAFVGCQPLIIIVLLSLSMGFNGLIFSGFNVTHVDMSPEFAGTLMGLTNCIANLCGFLAPAFVGAIVKNGQTLGNWAIVFITTSVIFVISGTVYNLFCSAELQPWGQTQPRSPKDPSSKREASHLPPR